MNKRWLTAGCMASLLLLTGFAWAQGTEQPRLSGAFDYTGKPLLETALKNDNYFAHRFGIDLFDIDYELGLDSYMQYLESGQERNPNHRADIFARMGLICIYALPDRDSKRAQEYFAQAIEAAEPDYFSRHLYMARTNYAAFLRGYEERFETFLALAQWLGSIDEAMVRRSLGIERNPNEVVARNTDIDTGEVREIRRSEADEWLLETYDKSANDRVRLLLEPVERYLNDRLPENCVESAMYTEKPVASMQRLVEETAGTPVAAYAETQMHRAETAQQMREMGEELLRQQQEEAEQQEQ